MRSINLALNWLCDLIFLPFHGANPWPGMLAASFVTALLFVGVFRLFSDQRALKRSKGRMLARALELLLFRHDMLVSLTAFPRILAANGRYFVQLLKPTSVAIAPSILLLIQLSCWFEYRPLIVGEPVLLTADFTSDFSVVSDEVVLTSSDGLIAETSGLRIPTLSQINWRLRAIDSGDGWVEIAAGGDAVRKDVRIGSGLQRVSETRVRSGFWNGLLHPSEQPITEPSPVERIRVQYPRRELSVADFEVHWVVAFLLLTMAFGLALGRILRVSF